MLWVGHFARFQGKTPMKMASPASLRRGPWQSSLALLARPGRNSSFFEVNSWFSWCCFALQALNKNVISKEEMAKKSEHLARCDAQDELHWYFWRWYCWLRYEKAVLVDILRTEARACHAKHGQTWSKSLVLQRSHPPRSQPCVNPLLNHRLCLILGGGIVGIVWDGMMSDIQRYWLILDNLMQFFCALLVFKCF